MERSTAQLHKHVVEALLGILDATNKPSNIGLLVLLSQLLVLPYFVWTTAIVTVVAIGLHDPVSVTRKTFFCTIDREDLKFVLNSYTLICSISACILDGMLYYTETLPRV